MRRLEDWPERLARILGSALHCSFVWGEWDCVLFVAACVEAVTGADPIPEIRGQYRTELGAKKLLLENGCRDIGDVWDRKLGADRIASPFARRGDVVLLESCGGICTGMDAMFVMPDGLVTRPVLSCESAWRVG